jgi:hypothetical protein
MEYIPVVNRVLSLCSLCCILAACAVSLLLVLYSYCLCCILAACAVSLLLVLYPCSLCSILAPCALSLLLVLYPCCLRSIHFLPQSIILLSLPLLLCQYFFCSAAGRPADAVQYQQD